MEDLSKIKVIFIDVDGTLTNSAKEVPKKNADSIKKVVEKGIKVVICSGRSNSNVEIISRLANASPYIISSNGAQIFNYSSKKTIFAHTMDRKIVGKITNYINQKKAGFIINCSDKRYGNMYLNRKLDEEDENINTVEDVDKSIYQLVVEAYSYELLEELIAYIKNEKDVKILNYSPAYMNGIKTEKHYYLDVNSKDVNKGRAVENFLDIFGIKKEEAMCFGDHVNDESMFDVCGVGVAMGNANETIKKKAKYVTKTNDEYGVSYFLENYILKESSK